MINAVLVKIKELATLYLLSTIIITALFNLLLDCKSLRKKGLKKEERISMIIGLIYLIGGTAFYIVAKFVL